MPGHLEELLKKYGIGPTGQPMGQTPGVAEAESNVPGYIQAIMDRRGQMPTPYKDYGPPTPESNQGARLDSGASMQTSMAPTPEREIDPIQVQGEEKDRDRERRRLQGLADIAEGLGSIGRGGPYTAGGVMFKQGNREPFIAEGIRAEMDRNDDKLTESERNMYGQLMSSVSGQRVDVPKDMTRSRLEQFMKPYMAGMTSFSPASIMRAQAMTKNADTNAQRQNFTETTVQPWREGEKDQDQILRERSLGVAEGNLEQRTMAGARIPNKSEDVLRGYAVGLDSLARVRRQFQDLRGEVGPVQGRIQKVLIAAGAGDKELAALNASTVDALAMYIRSISGAQVHVGEYERLKNLYPGIVQTPEQFEALLDNMEDAYESRLQAEIRLQKANRRDTTGIEAAVRVPKQGGLPTGGAIGAPVTTQTTGYKSYILNGEPVDIPDAEHAKFLQWLEEHPEAKARPKFRSASDMGGTPEG